ncbi:hypothetical protein [Streptomyces sp. IMTB 2501]|uniref:hypothetical protein n=1 Tax=Streptomyces sp. IMTB 2501 TaxID=1776340 RepID=UPI0015BB5520|nr:hypothetical protein [Streptomyces sp. IMTB 2501]
MTVSRWGMAGVFRGHDTSKAVAAHMDVGPGAVSRLVGCVAVKGLVAASPTPPPGARTSSS